MGAALAFFLYVLGTNRYDGMEMEMGPMDFDDGRGTMEEGERRKERGDEGGGRGGIEEGREMKEEWG